MPAIGGLRSRPEPDVGPASGARGSATWPSTAGRHRRRRRRVAVPLVPALCQPAGTALPRSSSFCRCRARVCVYVHIRRGAYERHVNEYIHARTHAHTHILGMWVSWQATRGEQMHAMPRCIRLRLYIGIADGVSGAWVYSCR